MYLNLLWNLFVGWNPRLGYPPLMKDERELVLGWLLKLMHLLKKIEVMDSSHFPKWPAHEIWFVHGLLLTPHWEIVHTKDINFSLQIL